MRKFLGLSFVLFQLSLSAAVAQDSLWIRYDNRFTDNVAIRIADVDELEILNSRITVGEQSYSVPANQASFMFANPGRILLKPDTYADTDYMNANAKEGYNFKHCLESEHFAVFWDVRFGDDPTYIKHPDDGNVANVYNVLNVAEKCWQMYADELGFLVEGQSTTDKYKIQLYIPYQGKWRADASGTNGANGGMTGIGHFNPWAANARGGHTVAHEVGHTFQYLVSADLGTDAAWHYDRGWRWGWGGGNDNGWWESCADWQAYQIFPERQFTDGEYFEQHLDNHYKNMLHDDWRYACCYIHDWWCMKRGRKVIGQMWRETIPYEDPIETYKRMHKLTQTAFCDELMEGYMRMATWDIDGVRDRAKHRIGQHKNYLNAVNAAQGIYSTSPATCIQNYGYHITNMQCPSVGTTVKATFSGLTNAEGYHYVYPERAGWRYAFVALMTDNTRVYGEIKADAEGTAELTIPSGHGTCRNLFFVAMGAPTVHWPHPWTSGKASKDWSQNEEQWPYQVKFENTKPL